MNKQLRKIQAELNVPKMHQNKFGGYSYRNLEDIFEAVKPLLDKYEADLVVTDDVVEIAGRFYVRATATFTSADGEKKVHAYAREEDEKKGMSASQLTGATSSYARKYALGGLFLLDDNKDADATNTHGKEEKPEPAPNKKVSKQEAAEKELHALRMKIGHAIGLRLGKTQELPNRKAAEDLIFSIVGVHKTTDCHKKDKLQELLDVIEMIGAEK